MEDHHDSFNTAITDLPDDCLSFIFRHLDCVVDRDSFGLTCHRWLKIQSINRKSLQFQCSFSILHRYSLSQATLDTDSYNLHRLLVRFQNLEHLSLSGCTELPDSNLTYLKHYGSKLRSLHLDCSFSITDKGISSVADGCPTLQVISLYRCNITNLALQTLVDASLPLTHVNLSYCPFISDEGLKALTQGCSQLQALKLSNCRSVTGIGLAGSSSTLAYVDMEACPLQPEGIAGIVSGGGIKFLNISCLSCQLSRDGLVPIGAGSASRLRILNLRMCRTIGDESVAAIAKGCPVLQEWNLALCHEIRVLGWEAVGKFCNCLERLHVNRCRNLCDRGLQAIQNGCKKLSALYMNGNAQVSSVAEELFKLYRAHVQIKKEEMMFIGPDWTWNSNTSG